MNARQATLADNGLEGKSRILVVDDTPSNLRLLINILTSHGYVVHPADGATPAFRFLQSTIPDLILLDIKMPDMDGYEICARLKAEERTRDIPVIFISAADEALDKVKAFNSGGVDYIVKPFQPEEVLARIQTHLSLHRLQQRLEDVVRARTSELMETVERLHRESEERRRAEAALRDRDARIRRLVDADIIGVFFWEVGGRIWDANDAFLRMLQYEHEDLSMLNWRDLTPAEFRDADEQALAELRAHRKVKPYEKEYVCKDGTRVPVLIGAAFFDEPSDQGVAFVLDLTDRKHAEDRIRYMAQHDALTGLPNRTLFYDRVAQAIVQAHRHHQRVAVLFLDLDDFKHINDSLGHQVGDRLLRSAARRLQRCLREGDNVARLGGDEFVIALPALDDDKGVMLTADKVLEALREPFVLDAHHLHVTGSIGISLYPADGEDVEILMRAADTAMYHAKKKGRDNYQFFTAGLNEAARRRLVIANRLHEALAHNEFVLHYQPQIDFQSGCINATEALLRWHQPEIGLVSPTEFIHVAEETGVIVPVGEWVLRESCRQLKRWREAGHPTLQIAVNLSPYQFRRTGFPELVETVLRETGLPPSALELELTEGIFTMQNMENVAILEKIANMGVRLAVDDFGTGYSSLAYLQRFPIHTLKIDQSFVDGISEDANDTAIVSAIIAMAHNLKLKVVAEGVETAAQYEFLKAQGCFAGQGFYFSKALAEDRFIEMLDGNTRTYSAC